MNQNQSLMQLEMLDKMSKMLKETFLALQEICQQQIKNQSLQESNREHTVHKNTKKHHKKSEKSMRSEDDLGSGSDQSRKKSGKKRKQAKWELQGKPRPPLNAFMLFLRDSKFEIQQARPQLTSSQVSTYASTIWNDLPEQQKQKYRQQYRENRKLYQMELDEHMRRTGQDPRVKKQKKKSKKSKKNKQREDDRDVVEIQVNSSEQQDDSMMI